MQTTALLIAALSLASTPAIAATPKAKVASRTPSACVSLARDLDGLNRSLAMNFADNMADRHGRNRLDIKAEHNELLLRVQTTMGLMRDHHCRMPTSEPKGEQYADQAFSCGIAKIEASSGGKPIPDGLCDQFKWVAKPGGN